MKWLELEMRTTKFPICVLEKIIVLRMIRRFKIRNLLGLTLGTKQLSIDFIILSSPDEVTP